MLNSSRPIAYVSPISIQKVIIIVKLGSTQNCRSYVNIQHMSILMIFYCDVQRPIRRFLEMLERSFGDYLLSHILDSGDYSGVIFSYFWTSFQVF